MSQKQRTPEEIRFEEVLNWQGHQLKSFQSETPADLMPEATTFPQFFNANLLNPNRHIKYIKPDPQSNFRLFYLHLLRLSCQVEIDGQTNPVFLVNLRNYVLHPQFQILFTEDSQEMRDVYNDKQFKRFFMEFLFILDQQDFPDTELVINRYPIMDAVFIHILRSVFVNQGMEVEFHTKIPTQTVFQQLCQLLGMSLVSYGNCWKFEDSDMFCIQQPDGSLYLAYIQDQGSQVLMRTEAQDNIDSQNLFSMEMVEQPEPPGYTVPPVPTENFEGSYTKHYDSLVNKPLTTTSPYEIPNEYSPSSYVPTYNSPVIDSLPIQPYIQSYNQTLTLESTLSSNRPSQTNNFGLSSYAKTINARDQTRFEPDRVRMNGFPGVTQATRLQQFKPYDPNKKDLGNIKDSMISMVSDNYDFVDFTGATTSYKDKVPRHQLQNSRGMKPIVHLNREQLIDNLSHNQLEDRKSGPLSSSPIYESKNYLQSTTVGIHDTTSRFKPIEPAATYQYQPTSYSNLLLPQVSSYNPPTPMVHSTQSYMIQSESTPIVKLNNRNFQSSNIRGQSQLKSYLGSTALTPVAVTPIANRDMGDFYKDFTNSFMLQKLEQPYKSNVRAIKNRVRGVKRGGFTATSFLGGIGQSSFAKKLYEQTI